MEKEKGKPEGKRKPDEETGQKAEKPGGILTKLFQQNSNSNHGCP